MSESPRDILSELSTTSTESQVGIMVNRDTTASICRKLSSSTTQEVKYQSIYQKKDTPKQADNCCTRSNKKGMEFKFHLCGNTSFTNVFGYLSSTGITCPLLRGLSTEHRGISKNNIFLPYMLKSKCPSDFPKHEGNTPIFKDESIKHEICIKEINQTECSKKKNLAKFSNEIEKNLISEETGKNSTLDTATSFDFMAGDSISSKNIHDSKLSSLSNVPQWVCTSLVGTVCDHKVAVQRDYSHENNLSEENTSGIDEEKQLLYKTDIADNIEISRQCKQILPTIKEKGELENSGFHNTSMIMNKLCHTSDKSNDKEILTNHLSAGLEERDTTVIKHHSLHTARKKVVRTYRVYVAGGHYILDEEVVINKKDLYNTLNSHIAKILCRKGMNITRLQAFTWPALIRGCSAVIVGEKSCGKTLGYVVPLLSTILDTHQYASHRLPLGIGPLTVMIFSTWQSARYVADLVGSLLPTGTTLKTVTAWGGCGFEEEIRTGKELLGGCDILLTTAPYFIRLLTGGSTLKDGVMEGAFTTLTRCWHLVIDEADIVLENFSSEAKQIITMWGEERKKCTRSDMDLQAVLVSSKWTKSVSQLTQVLLPLLEPTVIISSPFEAAVATKVESHIYNVDNETEAYDIIVNVIASFYTQKKNMVFVKSDSDAEMLGSMIKNVAIYCLITKSSVSMNKLQQLVHEWHLMQGVVMIVSEKSEASLLCHDLSDAQTIFHTHIGSSWTTFTRRYGFMVDNFVTDVEQKSVDCESYIIIPQFSLAKTPKVLRELSRVNAEYEEEATVNLLSTQVSLSKGTALCYFLKAYGNCFEEYLCKFRHEFHVSDMSQNVPKAGEVTFEVKKVLNASQYLVRLTEYQGKSDRRRIDLSSHYHTIRSALRLYYADTSHHQPLAHVEKGTLCAVEDTGQWNRAEVVSINYSENTTLLEVFLIDEGKEMTFKLGSALFLPLHLATVPRLIVEVFLCSIQPFDQDREWTPQATNFICEVFDKHKKSQFVGQIALALGYTMWLSPVIEFSKIGKKYIQKKSLRGKLLSERFGMDNPTHLKNLEELCSRAHLPFRDEDVFSQEWIEAFKKAVQKIQIAGDANHLNTDTMACNEITAENNETVKNRKSIGDVLRSGVNCLNTVEIHKTKRFFQLEGVRDNMTMKPGSSHVTEIQTQEELPLDTEMRVHMAEVISPEEFYVIREDKLHE